MTERVYLSGDLARGYPAAPDIYYECTKCATVVSSMPKNADACKCRNIIVDTDAGRVALKDSTHFRVFRATGA